MELIVIDDSGSFKFTAKAKLDPNPDDEAGLKRNVKVIFALKPALIVKLKPILK